MKRAPFFLLCALWSAHAYADEDFAKREGQDRYREGLALHDAGRDAEALVKFSQAYTALKHVNVLYNLARAEQLTHHELDALGHYRQYLREAPNARPDERLLVEGYVRELSGRAGHLRIQAPAGAMITLDGTLAPEWRETLDVAPGPHTVLAAFGGRSKAATATARLGETETLTFTFEPDAPPPGHDERAKIKVVWPPPTYSIVLGAAGVAGLAIGTGFAVDAKSKSDALSTPTAVGACANGTGTAECRARQSAIDARTTSKTIAIAASAAGGVALAAGVVLWIVAPRIAERAQTGGVVPWVGPHGAGAAWNLGF